MKKLLLIFIFLLPTTPAFAKLKVVTTTPDLASIAQELGKDLVEAKSLARGEQDYHFLEPKPSYIVQVSQADLLIVVGMDLESGWLPVLLTQSRNSKIQKGQKGYLDASENIQALDVPTQALDRSMGDVHPQGNPHYWLNPENGLRIAQSIAQRLSEVDANNAKLYQQNLESFQKNLNDKLKAWQNIKVKLQGKKIITQHKSFSYFAQWAGLQERAYIEPKPGIPPSPSHLVKVIQTIQNEKIPLLLIENYYDSKAAKELSSKTGAKLLILPCSVGGEASIKSYTDLFDHLLNRISGVLNE